MPQSGGLPHSEIPGSKGARTSPGLFAACHVLHHLSAPRHPPDALRSLHPPSGNTTGWTTNTKNLNSHPGLPTGTRPAERPRQHTHAIHVACPGDDRSPPGHARDPHVFPTRRTSPSPSPRDAYESRHRHFTICKTEHRRSKRIDACHPDRSPHEVAGMVGGPGPIRTADLTLIRRAL